jgi:two-component system sensor histidine kinase BaeS
MNRLWVRLSLAFTAVIVVAIMAIGLTLRLTNAVLTNPWTPPPPEVIAYFERVRSEQSLPNPTTAIAVIGVVAVGAGIWMSRSLTAPLAELEAAAQAVGQQDFSQRVPAQGSQELVAVSTAFNEMTARLEQAETLRRNLLADVAHELRHPVHVLQGSMQAILDDVYPLSKEEIARLCNQTHHLTVLVNDLHVLAQAEAHQLPLRKQMADIGAFVKETVAALDPLADAKNVALRVELLGTMPELAVDTVRLRQAIHNLVDNGLRYTPEGGDITVSVEQVQDEIQVRVRDTGAGITPEQLPRVFDRFHRVDEAPSRDRSSTGLGLAIVKAIVETHGGTVTATSQVGEGSTFTISLPNPPPNY